MAVTKIDARPQPKTPKKKVAAYARVSTDNLDQKESLDAQKKHYEMYIKAHSTWEFAGLYFDEGVSGTKSETRNGLQNMLRDCNAGKINYILTKSVSRFARNTVDCLQIARDLKDKGIFIYFEKERIDTGNMDSELMLSIFSSFAAEESISISENEKWAIRKRFQDGTYKQSYLPYGYVKNENGEMIPDKQEAEIVRWIFNLAINGHSTHSICKLLRERNVPTRKGGKWSSSTVRDMLKNEKYMGDALFQKTYTDGSFRRHETKNSSKQIFIENHHEAIISREIFETANRLLEQRAAEKGIIKRQGKYQARYAFSGIIVCGECGGTFKRRIHDHGSEIAWACTTHIDDIQKCSMKYVRDDALKATITTMMNKLIFGRKIILFPYLAELKRCNANSEEIKLLKAELIKEAEKIDVLRHLLADKIIKPAMFIQDQNASNKRSEELRRQITQLSQIDTGNSEMVAETEKLLHFLDSAEMQTEFKDFFATDFIEKIIVYDRHSIGIQLKCGLTLKEALL